MDLRTEAAKLFANTRNDPPAELHERAHRLLQKVIRDPHPSLAPLTVDLACLTALTGYTSGQRNAGFTFTSAAESLAQDAGQPELIARAAGMKRLYYSAEVGIGTPHQAAKWGQRAVDNAEPGAMRAWALANLAPELAATKQRKACFEALSEADRQWSRGSGYGLFSTDGYLRPYRSPAPVIGMTGRSLALLGDGKGAPVSRTHPSLGTAREEHSGTVRLVVGGHGMCASARRLPDLAVNPPAHKRTGF